MPAVEAPVVRVSPTTKTRVRVGAALLSLTQGEFIDRAVAEYLEAHAEEFSHRLDLAREAFANGREASIAYLLGEDPKG
jgi:hypothetical protein